MKNLNENISIRLQNVLHAARLTMTDLEVLDPADLFALRNFGRKSYNEVLNCLASAGKRPGTFSDYPPEIRRAGRIDWYTEHRAQIWAKVGFDPYKVPTPAQLTIIWDAFKRETARDVLCALLSNQGACTFHNGVPRPDYEIIDEAVYYAERLIERLQDPKPADERPFKGLE